MPLPEDAPAPLVRCLEGRADLADALKDFMGSPRPRLEAEQAADLAEGLGGIPASLRALFFLAEARSRAPISHFRAGAVVRGRSGALYLGANLELPGTPIALTVHAEQAATYQAFLAGEGGITHLGVGASPCGGCRQFLCELTRSEDLELVLPQGEFTLDELLPGAFRPEDLGVIRRWMDEPAEPPSWDESDPIQLARSRAACSYAPYTQTREGVVLVAEDGTCLPGSRVESAAFNPTLTAMGASLSVWSLGGAPKVVRAVHVKLGESALAPERYAAPIVKSCWELELEQYCFPTADLA